MALKDLVLRMRETNELLQNVNAKLLFNGGTPGQRQAWLKLQHSYESKLRHLAQRIQGYLQGNIIQIIFKNTETNQKYEITYTNISREDATYHLEMVMNYRKVNIQILDIKEMRTENSLREL